MIAPVTWTSVLSLSGRDRVRLLHNLCTNDIYKLATGRDGASLGKHPKENFLVTPEGGACMAAALNRQGKMIAVFIVWMHANEILLEVDRAAATHLRDHIRASIISDRVEVDDVTGHWSCYVADRIIPGVLAFPCPPIRGGCRLIHPATAAVTTEVLNVETALDWRQICLEAGWPRWGTDMDGSMLPMEAGLDPIAISYTKGCYLGQEVIQRVKTYSEPPRELKQLHFDGPAPSTPTPVRDADGNVVGETRSGPDPNVRQWTGHLALALMKKSHAKDGTRVDGAVVRDLPWHHWT